MPAVSGVRPAGAVGVTLTELAADGDVSGATTDFSETSVRRPSTCVWAEDSRLLVTARQTGRLKGREATMSATDVLVGNLVPASRDASCALTDSRGRQRAQQPCALTDGVLGSPWSPDDDPRCAQKPCDRHRRVLHQAPRGLRLPLTAG